MQLCSILGTGTTQEKNEERTWIPKAVVGYGKKGISGGIGSEGRGGGFVALPRTSLRLLSEERNKGSNHIHHVVRS